MVWISYHRGLLLAVNAGFFWVFANYWYYKRDIQRIMRERRPHKWSADMASKTSKGGRTAPQ
jgi:hypothetical protein